MLTLLAILTTITAPSPAMTIDELQDFQNHAEAARRLQVGEVLQPGIENAPRKWAFESTVDFDDVAPFSDCDDAVGPFAEIGR